jgi:hypothetical protein
MPCGAASSLKASPSHHLAGKVNHDGDDEHDDDDADRHPSLKDIASEFATAEQQRRQEDKNQKKWVHSEPLAVHCNFKASHYGLGTIVASFDGGPGAAFKYVLGLRTIWSSMTPSSRT